MPAIPEKQVKKQVKNDNVGKSGNSGKSGKSFRKNSAQDAEPNTSLEDILTATIDGKVIVKDDFNILDDRIIIILLGDEHLGSKYHDKKAYRKMLDWIYENKNVYVIGMGDNCETATKDSVGAGVFDQDEIVQKQMEQYIEFMRLIAQEGRLIGLHIGNHEERLRKFSGFNLTKTIADQLGVSYLGYGCLHKFKIGRNFYTLYTTHGSTGARLSHTKVKGCIDLSRWVEADIYGMGHTHQLSEHKGLYYKIEHNSVKESQKHFVLSGSYLKHWGSYGMMKGYELLPIGSPRIKLYADEKHVQVSL